MNMAAKLRAGTQESHRLAESTGFIRCFLKGAVEPSSYRQLVASLYCVYSAMEEELERHREHPVLAPVYFPELARKPALERDLLFYYGEGWAAQRSVSQATRAYVERIREVGQREPELLVAHCYTRYLGDLSGGQALGRIAQRALGLTGEEGTAFYRFSHIPDEKEFKGRYRERLDSLPVSEEQAERIVAEANRTFRLNMEVFTELEPALIAALGASRFDALTRREPPATA